MAGGYTVPDADALDALVTRLVKAEERISELERPTGSQLYDSLANQSSPAVAVNSASSFTLTTSYANITSATVPVPTGYTRAVVTAMSGINGVTASGGGDRMLAQVSIDGTFGPTATSYATIAQPFAFASAYAVATLASVGASISVVLQARLLFGPGDFTGTNATLAVTVMFLR
jgi:hypothetical protein